MPRSAVAASDPTRHLERIPFGASVEEVVRVVRRDGGVILAEALTKEQVASVNQELDDRFAALEEGNFGSAEKNYLADFMGSRTKRLVHCLRFSKTYREAIVGSPIVANYVAAFVTGKPGQHALLSSHAIEIFPGERAQELHRDSRGLQEALDLNHAGGRDLLVNTLLALSDVTEDVGATRVVPGSHLWNDFSKPASQDDTIPVTMDRGDLFFFTGKVLHGGGANVTQDRSRRVLSTAFTVSFFMGEEAWPFAIPVEEVRTYPTQVQAHLGFRSPSYRGEEPGFLWRVDARPLEEHLKL